MKVVDVPVDPSARQSRLLKIVPMSLYYRAGVEFINPDSTQLEAFCATFGGVPDRTFGTP
jgi:hypothetical protein